jgi:hypothetical protein
MSLSIKGRVDLLKLILVAEQSKSYVCGHLIAGIAGSDPPEGIDICHLCFVVCYVGGGLCDEVIAHSEEFCVYVCTCICMLARILNSEEG